METFKEDRRVVVIPSLDHTRQPEEVKHVRMLLLSQAKSQGILHIIITIYVLAIVSDLDGSPTFATGQFHGPRSCKRCHVKGSWLCWGVNDDLSGKPFLGISDASIINKDQ